MEERETYAAVFNDQYQEYKDLHRDISSTFSRFRELDLLMSQLLRDGKGPQVRRCLTNFLEAESKVPQLTRGGEGRRAAYQLHLCFSVSRSSGESRVF